MGSAGGIAKDLEQFFDKANNDKANWFSFVLGQG